MKKCLLSKRQFDSDDLLKQHYINFHNVHPENYFFKKLFGKKRTNFKPGKCLLCNEFNPTLENQKLHKFRKQYSKGKNRAFKDRPLNTYRNGAIKVFEITAKEHSAQYDFEDSDDLIDKFLNNVRFTFVPTEEVLIKCGFSLENYQLPPYSSGIPIISKNYWITKAYRTVYSNDFLFHNLRHDIKKRVITNGQCGSSWQFKQFIHMCFKVYNENLTLKS